jgi:hypothetical protein
MIGFKQYFDESYADMASHISGDEISAVKEILSDNKETIDKYVNVVDMIVGMSHMVGLIKPTFENNIKIIRNFADVLRHPKKLKYWKKLASSLATSGKLTLANPLMLMPMVMPALSFLPLHKQAVVAACIKIISTTYFYLSMLAQKDIKYEFLKKRLEDIRTILPEIDSKHQS